MAIFLNTHNVNCCGHSHDGLCSDVFSYSNCIYNDGVCYYGCVCNDGGVCDHIGVYNRYGICKCHCVWNRHYDWNGYNDRVGGSGDNTNNHGGDDDPYNIIIE